MKRIMVVLSIVMFVFAIAAVPVVAAEINPLDNNDQWFRSLEQKLKKEGKSTHTGLPESILNCTIFVAGINDFDSRTSTNANMISEKGLITLKNFLIVGNASTINGAIMKGVYENGYIGIVIVTPNFPDNCFYFQKVGNGLYPKYISSGGDINRIKSLRDKLDFGLYFTDITQKLIKKNK